MRLDLIVIAAASGVMAYGFSVIVIVLKREAVTAFRNWRVQREFRAYERQLAKDVLKAQKARDREQLEWRRGW